MKIVLASKPSSQKYYHGSRTKFPIGFTLKSKPGRRIFDEYEEELVEEILEANRPKSKPARSKCVYMVMENDPDLIERVGGYTKFIYEVEPQGNSHIGDVGWWAEIYKLAFNFDDPKLAELANECAKNYWAGKKTKSNASLEYISLQATVMRLI